MNKKQQVARLIKRNKKGLSWNEQYQITNWFESLGRIKDAATVRKDKPQPLPASMIEMIF